MNKGLVIRLIAGEYKVFDLESSTIFNAKPRGVMRIKSSAPKVGDYVDYTLIDENNAIIEKIHNRSNDLIRPYISNIDQAFVIFSVKEPDLNLNLLDKFLVTLEFNNITPIIVFNKWDLIDKQTNTMNEYEKKLASELDFMSYVKSVYLSALTGKRTEKLMQAVETVLENAGREISAGMLNDVLQDAYALNSPTYQKGKQLKIFYATQTGTKPPVFTLFVNDVNLMQNNYLRYLENNIRKAFDFSGTPILIKMKCKKDEDF